LELYFTRQEGRNDMAIARTAEARTPLSRERVLHAAIALADEGGIASLSMRRLGQSLGVEAMSLYNHARNKEDILDGIVDVVVGEIQIVPGTADWTTTMRQQVGEARTVLRRHPWMPRVMETRANPGPATMRYLEIVITILREGGLSVDQTHHAMHVLGSRHFGFNQELFDAPGETGEQPQITALAASQMAAAYPYIAELSAAVSHEGGLGGCDDDVEFAFGLDLILDGLERLRAAAA
jgi:AcrR family transcriptional regulator